MKYKHSLIIGIILILCLGFSSFLLLNQNKTDISEAPANNKPTQLYQHNSNQDIQNSNSNQINNQNIKYFPYSEQVFNNHSGKKRVLFFYANWCPTCRPADANFKDLEKKIPDDTVVIRVNYKDSDTDDMEKELANKYKITYQHSFIQIDSQGNEITRWNGGKINELLANLK